MQTQDLLFQLVKGMSRAEKRHFNIFARSYQGKSKNHTVKLFAAYDKLDSFNAAALAHAVRNESFAAYLSALKYQLLNLVLDSLARHDHDGTVVGELHRQLAHITVLYRRGMFAHCLKVIKRARAKAALYEQHSILLDLPAWERRLQHDCPGAKTEETIAALFKQSATTLLDQQQNIAYEQLLSAAQLLRRRHARTRQTERQQEIEQLLEHELVRDDSSARCKGNRLQQLEIRASLQLMLGDYVSAHRAFDKALEIWRENAAMQQIYPAQYKRTLDQFLNCCIAVGHFSNFTPMLNSLKELSLKQSGDKTYYVGSILFLELTQALNCGLIDRGMEIVREIQQNLGSVRKGIRDSRALTICYNCAVMSFVGGDCGLALEMLNEIVNSRTVESKRDIQEFAHIFRLLLYFELGETELLEAQFRATSRYLRKHSAYHDFEQQVVQMLKTLLNKTEESHRGAYVELADFCRTLARAGTRQSMPVGLSEVLLWVQARLKRQSLRAAYVEDVKDGDGVFSANALTHANG